MAYTSGAAEILADAMRKRSKYVVLSAIKSIDALIKEAYRLDPRIDGCLADRNGTVKPGGLLGLTKEYHVELIYRPNTVENVNDVIVDNGSWKPSDALSANGNMPAVIQIVTRDVNSLKRRIDSDEQKLYELCPGYKSVNFEWLEGAAEGYSTVWIKVAYAVDRDQYEMYRQMAAREMERVDRRFLGQGNIPKIIKAFLAFSYIQQTCTYDQESADLMLTDETDSIERLWVTIPYGVLVKKSAVCEGIARAYKLFLNHYGIENRIVSGSIIEGSMPHCWNMVCLNDKYYHVDVTYGIEGKGIYIGRFLKDDISMSETHYWKTSDYPACTSARADYNYVEDYITDHLTDLIRMGVDPCYLCPEEVKE